MKIIEKKFTCQSKYSLYFFSEGHDLGVCQRAIREVFNIPVGTATLWLALYDTSRSGREPVLVTKTSQIGYPVLRCRNWEFSHDSLDKMFKPYIGKTIYVEVWYDIPKGA